LHACAKGIHGGLDIPELKKMIGMSQEEEEEEDRFEAITRHLMGRKVEEEGAGLHDNEPEDLPPLGPPLQVKAKAGDIFLLHPETAHEGGPNYSDEIRSMVYFRLRHLS